MPVRKFKTKPFEIEAIQFTGDNVNEIWDAFGISGIYGPTEVNPDHLLLTTRDGTIAPCYKNSWVIADNKPDSFYSCDPDHFEQKYSEVLAEEVHVIEQVRNALYGYGMTNGTAEQCVDDMLREGIRFSAE